MWGGTRFGPLGIDFDLLLLRSLVSDRLSCPCDRKHELFLIKDYKGTGIKKKCTDN